MDIRRLWATLAERTSSKRRIYTDRIRAVRKVLKQLRIRERALQELERSVADEERREEISGKLSVLRAQRVKGVSVLRGLRGERRGTSQRRAPEARSEASRTSSTRSPFTERARRAARALGREPPV